MNGGLKMKEIQWHKFKKRYAEFEEHESHNVDMTEPFIIWDCKTPSVNEKVLVSDGCDIWIDVWVNLEGGCETFMDTTIDWKPLYWAELPELPEKVMK